ncbi:Uncharacterized protein dnm_086030 [Desulfonema magnum]|uniref:Uncharacterized protein n=1 Tax=Desulfonema magnum TaxID=45655 RepID=A0A975GSX7_9BACT|nr:Uncharacterized protein dnm_086030 [Desulfonema magnum]
MLIHVIISGRMAELLLNCKSFPRVLGNFSCRKIISSGEKAGFLRGPATARKLFDLLIVYMKVLGVRCQVLGVRC